MTPHLIHGIVYGAFFLTAYRTGKFTTSPEIDVNVKFAVFFIKRNVFDV